MTDAEISRALALAIGWPESAIIVTHEQCFIWYGRDGRGFDYRDPAVIWPIAEKFDCFPTKAAWGGGGCASVDETIPRVFANTAAKALALAVIRGKA